MVKKMSIEASFSDNLKSNYAFLAKTVFDLHMLIQAQSEALYEEREMGFPVSVSSTLLFLTHTSKASITQIAKALNHPHQVISKRIKKLLKLQLVSGTKDPEDKRTTLYSLSPAGKEKAQILTLYSVDAANAFRELSEEVGIDIQEVLNTSIAALQNKSFGERFPKQNLSYSQQLTATKLK